jgi:transposase
MFSRFNSPRRVSSYLGLTPSSGASGDVLEANGRITKAGNSHVRTSLAEGLSSIVRQNNMPKQLRSEQVVSDAVRAHCECANRRIKKRYDHLVKEKKMPNKTKIALANELARWIWSVGLMVEKEQASEVSV